MKDVNELFLNDAVYTKDTNNALSIDSIIEGIDRFAKLLNITCFIIDFDMHKLIYRSDKMLYLDDTSIDEPQRECENPYWARVSEETLGNLLLIRDKYPCVRQNINPEEFTTHVCTIDYPIIIKSHEFFINQKFIPLVMRPDGITKIALFIIGPSTCNHMESFILIESRIRYRFDFKAGMYMEFNMHRSLSNVEKAILLHVQKGFTIEEIADKLNVSVSTIKTHRMHIFKKLQVQTMPETLTVISNYNLI